MPSFKDLSWTAQDMTVVGTAEGRIPVSLPVRAPAWSPQERAEAAAELAALLNRGGRRGPARDVQRKVHAAVEAYHDAHPDAERIGPSIGELSRSAGLSPRWVQLALEELAEQGLVTRRPGVPRALWLRVRPDGTPVQKQAGTR